MISMGGGSGVWASSSCSSSPPLCIPDGALDRMVPSLLMTRWNRQKKKVASRFFFKLYIHSQKAKTEMDLSQIWLQKLKITTQLVVVVSCSNWIHMQTRKTPSGKEKVPEMLLTSSMMSSWGRSGCPRSMLFLLSSLPVPVNASPRYSGVKRVNYSQRH